MADEEPEGDADEPKKKSKKPLLIGLVLLLVGAGGGFGAVSAGLLGGSGDGHEEDAKKPRDLEQVAFVPIDPLLVTVGTASHQRHLRFQAQLEVAPDDVQAVSLVMPRVTDILNGYLRAVELTDIENPAALVKLRAQMLRRIQIVVGDGLVSDLLVSEFVLN